MGSTRSLRFHAPLRSFPEPYLTEALSGHPEHLALVAATPAAIVALASCRAVAGSTAELAVLVEDTRQRQGIGARLLKRLIEHADRSGLRTLRATLLTEQEWVVRPLRTYGTCTAVMSKGVLEVTVRRPATDGHISYNRDIASENASTTQPPTIGCVVDRIWSPASRYR